MFKTGFQGGEQGMKDVEEAALTGAFFDMINSYPKPVVMLAEGAAWLAVLECFVLEILW